MGAEGRLKLRERWRKAYTRFCIAPRLLRLAGDAKWELIPPVVVFQNSRLIASKLMTVIRSENSTIETRDRIVMSGGLQPPHYQGGAPMPIAIAAITSELRSQFLEGLAPPDRKTILSAATQLRFAANSVATNQGHPADRLFLLTKGSARHFFVTEEGKKLLLKWLGPGDLFGGRTILSSRSSYLVSTEMVKDSSVFVWDRTTIRGLVERYPRLLENALLTASDYVSWHLTSYIGLACCAARQRVAQTLVTLARSVGQHAPDGIALHITNEELANAANVTPFTASRLISEWQRSHVLEKHRGKLVLRSPERLLLRTE